MFRQLNAALVAAATLMATAVAAQPGGQSHQTAGPAALTAALNAEASAQPASYRSAFENYRRFEATEIASWREANEEVARIGGWKAYAKEAQSGANQSAEGAVTPATDPHAGHHAH